ncbi:MAG: hypothetical protein ACT4SY_11565 [Hyphomicrobiales bacterium]
MARTIAGAFMLLAITVGVSQAEVRNFFAPVVGGARLDACLSNVNDCGKPAADAFCKGLGYETALIFQREPAAVPTRRLASGEICEGGSCTAFKQIKCFAPGDAVATVRG